MKRYLTIKTAKNAILALFLAASQPFLGHLAAEDSIPQTIGPFGGLNNADSSLVIPASAAQDLLNVDITPGGKSIKKRDGYDLFRTLTISTSPVHGIYNFTTSNGNQVSLFFNDRRCESYINGSVTILVTSATFGASYQCIDSQGYAYCANSERDWILKTDGSTFLKVNNVNSTGTLVAVTPERLVLSGFSDAPNRVDFSKSNDFGTWAVGGDATDPMTFTITSPGSKITHIVYAFGRVMWFKDSSFGFILTGQADLFTDWQIVTVSPNVGTKDNASVYFNGILYFKGQDSHLYSFDGSNLTCLSHDIQGIIDLAQTANALSSELTSRADWETGTQSPADFLSTTEVPGNLSQVYASYEDSTNDQFNQGTFSPAGSYSAIGNSLFLTTFTLTNLNETDFTGSGTVMDNTTISLVPGHVVLDFSGSNFEGIGCYEGAVNSNATSGSPVSSLARSFTADETFWIDSLKLKLSRSNSMTADLSVYIYGDTSGCGNTSVLVASATIAYTDIGTTATDAVVSFTNNYQIQNGTRYWIIITHSEVIGEDWNWHYPNSLCEDDEYHCTYGPYCFGTACGPKSSDGKYLYMVYGKSYEPTGSFTSQAFNVGYSSADYVWPWGEFSADSTLNGQTITYETQGSTSETGPWTPLTPIVPPAITTAAVSQFIRYKATLTTSDTKITPQLNDAQFALSSAIRRHGTFISRTFSTGFAAPVYGVLDSLQVDINGGNLSNAFYTQSSADGITWDARAALSAVSKVSSTGKRYIRTIMESTATVRSGDIAYTQFEDFGFDSKSTGSYTTRAIEIGNAVQEWEPISINYDLDEASMTFQFNASSSTTFFESSWTFITNGEIPQNATNTYAAVRAFFVISVATQSPTLYDIKVSWTEGSASDKSYMEVFEDKIMYSLAYGQGASYNNRVINFDLINNIFTLYDLKSNGFFVKNQSLYFGDSTSGNIYKYGDTLSDNGEAINAYWKSKDFFGDSPFTEKEFNYISVAAAGVQSSTATVSYTINGSSTTSFSFSFTKADQTLKRINKRLPAGKVGSIFNIQIENDAANQPFEIFGIQFGIRPKPWKAE